MKKKKELSTTGTVKFRDILKKIVSTVPDNRIKKGKGSRKKKPP